VGAKLILFSDINFFFSESTLITGFWQLASGNCISKLKFNHAKNLITEIGQTSESG
jgi:hypothetical protein